jgi:hypothetical protein
MPTHPASPARLNPDLDPAAADRSAILTMIAVSRLLTHSSAHLAHLARSPARNYPTAAVCLHTRPTARSDHQHLTLMHLLP